MHCVYTGCVGVYSVGDIGVRQWGVCGLYVECGVQLVCGYVHMCLVAEDSWYIDVCVYVCKCD